MLSLNGLSLEDIQEKIIKAKQLKIVGGINSSTQEDEDNQLKMSQYSGVVEYHPEELVITVKAGTTIKQLNDVLAKKNQVTSFSTDNNISTIGGAYATGSPDLRDAVLGIKIIDGQGRLLTFGGQVMKNVAGYDVARLLVGSKGQLAVICEISFKIIPKNYAYIVTDKIMTKNKLENKSAVIDRINSGLKNIFDPNRVFI